jgi:Xaa-Pro dipeptidase
VFETRLEKIYQQMTEHSIDIAMVTSPTNIYFLTGFYSDPHERFMALILDRGTGETSLFVPALDAEIAQSASFVKRIIPVSDTDHPYRLLQKEVGRSVSTFGIEKKIMSMHQADKIAEAFASVQFFDLEEWLVSMRSYKSSEDIQIVRKAIHVIEQVMHRGLEKLTVGMTELELTAEMEYQMKVLGADRPAFTTIVLSGSNSALPHGRPGPRKIDWGDFLLLDMGVFVQGYCSDITRTFLIGEGTEEQRRIYDTVLKANLQAIEAVKVGEPISKVDLAARDYITANGYGEYFTHRVGHGLGLDVHEPPSIHAQNLLSMKPGLLFTIEPGIYVPNIGGVRIEDDIYINEAGQTEVLTTFPKEIKNLCC